jgi:tetratricopeptide (TPR) repeat protein
VVPSSKEASRSWEKVFLPIHYIKQFPRQGPLLDQRRLILVGSISALVSDQIVSGMSESLPVQPKGDIENKLATAKLYLESGKYEAAYELYAAVRDANPARDEARAGLDHVRGAIKTHTSPTTHWRVVYRLMFADFQKGNFQDAVETGRVYASDGLDIYEFWELLGAASNAMGETGFAVSCFEKAVRLSPRNAQAYSNLGVAYKSMGRLEQSETAYRTAITLDSNQAEPLNNLGNLLIEKGSPQEAVEFLKMALQLQPAYRDAHINLGIAFHKIGKFEAALRCYRAAIEMDAGDSKLQNNLGVTLQMLGSYDEAMHAYALASSLNPENLEASENLMALMTIKRPPKNIQSHIAKVDRDVRAAHREPFSGSRETGNGVIPFIKNLLELVPATNPEFRTSQTQIYRRSGRDLNCTRHKSVFDTHNVIPEFCFGCYKLQIEPRNVIDLIKLFLFFDELDLNKIRKCFVELRPDIKGFYKGLIYCDSIDDADEIAVKLRGRLRERVGGYLDLDLKRGCSEFPLRFPEYAQINRSGPQLMEFRDDWRDLEMMHDAAYLDLRPKSMMPTLSGTSLQDIAVMRKWFDYAKGLNDASCEALQIDDVLYPEIYEIGRSRRHRFKAPHDDPAIL